jgi:hypothetical protein
MIMAEVRSHLSRRNMLIGLAAGGVATAGTVATQGFAESGSFASLLRPIGRAPSGLPLRYASYRDWKAQIGSRFTAHSGQVLELVDVQAFSHEGDRPSTIRDRGFVARFDIVKGAALPDDLYAFAEAGGGVFDMFMSNAGPDKPLRMLAVFN